MEFFASKTSHLTVFLKSPASETVKISNNLSLGLITIRKTGYLLHRNGCAPLHVPKHEHYNQP
jgi:hypothetical protein